MTESPNGMMKFIDSVTYKRPEPEFDFFRSTPAGGGPIARITSALFATEAAALGLDIVTKISDRITFGNMDNAVDQKTLGAGLLLAMWATGIAFYESVRRNI